MPVRCAAPRRLPERKGAAKPRRPCASCSRTSRRTRGTLTRCGRCCAACPDRLLVRPARVARGGALAREDCELACDGDARARSARTSAPPTAKALLALVPVCDKPQNPLLGATTMTSGKGASRAHHTHRGEPAGQGCGGVRRRRARGALVRSELHRRRIRRRGHAGMVRRGLHDRGRAGLSRVPRLGGRLRRGNATGASWRPTGEASLNALDAACGRFARVVRNIRMEELSPFTDSDRENALYARLHDGRATGFGLLSEWAGNCADRPREVEAETKCTPIKRPSPSWTTRRSSALFDYLRGDSVTAHLRSPNNLTEASAASSTISALGASSARGGHSQPAISRWQRLALPRRCGADRAFGAARAQHSTPSPRRSSTRSAATATARTTTLSVITQDGNSTPSSAASTACGSCIPPLNRRSPPAIPATARRSGSTVPR